MKTYTYLWGLLAFIILGCSKSSPDEQESKKEPNVATSYTVLLDANNSLSATLLNADATFISKSSKESTFNAISTSVIKYDDDKAYSFYKKTSDCDGEIVYYDFLNEEEQLLTIFPDILDCELNVLSIINTNSSFFIAYEITETTSPKKYVIRKVDRNATEFTFLELELSKKPMNMTFSNDRLFVLSLDVGITNENEVIVVDNMNFKVINTQGLGYDVKKIFKDSNGDIIFGYDELHTVLNKETLAVSYTRYGIGTEPKFADTALHDLDSEDKLYYSMPAEDLATSSIPAVYDLKNNLATLYIYENFLTPAQLEVEYEIEKTTAVSYDEQNNILLIGYKKSGNQDLGGILRIKPVPDLEFLDNIDLPGIPYDIIVH
ncbi:hypothetical protein CLV91_2071 [Maribacter vaceletii]|uniref:Uncharacterized protein n=1 Tax=Maribacter vaceletii TaxID=1206816 RepID=A0A495E8V1_9FLAO|nr:hypothetical protein [Maribacter vaceletii]RKR13354.1 hypothetical protein CLV91_2071 [Maribacter vaceletii]